jgi:hypothetical protein
MSNYTEKQNLFVFIIPKYRVDETALVPIFNIDSDFSENENFFREDTLAKYNNESERCAEELYEKHKGIEDPVERLQKMLDDIPAYSNGEQRFIVGNPTYSGDYSIRLTEVCNFIVVSIAFIG